VQADIGYTFLKTANNSGWLYLP